MAKASMRIQLSVKEIYEQLRANCKHKIRNPIREKITEDMVSQVLEERS